MNNTKNKIIAISGKSGCGNTTISKLLSDELDYKHINYTFRQMAEEKNIDLFEFLEIAKTDEKYDRELDQHQKQLALEYNSVLGSRLAIWLLKDDAYTVYLNAEVEIRSKNIHKREGGDYNNILRKTKTRDKNDHNRFLKIYEIDNDNYSFADLIINVDGKGLSEIVNEILNNYSGYLKN